MIDATTTKFADKLAFMSKKKSMNFIKQNLYVDGENRE